MGATDPPGVGETLADSDALGAGDELAVGVPVVDTVGEADGDMAADGLKVGVALADAVAVADMAGVAFAAGDILGTDVAGAEVVGLDAACPECAPGVWCAEAARAIPPAADAASSPTTIEAIVSGRASRRWRLCLPGRDGADREAGDSRADVTVRDGPWSSGSSRNVRVTASAPSARSPVSPPLPPRP